MIYLSENAGLYVVYLVYSSLQLQHFCRVHFLQHLLEILTYLQIDQDCVDSGQLF